MTKASLHSRKTGQNVAKKFYRRANSPERRRVQLDERSAGCCRQRSRANDRRAHLVVGARRHPLPEPPPAGAVFRSHGAAAAGFFVTFEGREDNVVRLELEEEDTRGGSTYFGSGETCI